MADIFISYARADEERACSLARNLEAQGWSVSWDRSIPAGEAWRKYVEEELNEAGCVVVLWSRSSVDSSWVYEEAERAHKRGVMIPALFDDVIPPLGFGAIQAARLEGWSGTPDYPRFRELLKAIERRLGPSPSWRKENEARHEEHRKVNRRPAVSDSWYLSIEGQIEGPFRGEEVLEKIRSGSFACDVYIFAHGMKGWALITEWLPSDL